VRGAARLAAVLRERRDEALLYKRLATLSEDVPLRAALADLVWGGGPRRAFEALCADLGSQALRRRALRWAG